MDENEINDIRKPNDFKVITFSGFSRSKVKLELIKSINNSDIEPSCYWCIELICAGHYNDIWNAVILYSSRYIHLSNPKLHIYLSRRFETFKNIVNNGYRDNELYLRNNSDIRKLFGEMIAIICLSKKSHAFENYAIKSDDDFDVTNITNRLKAPTIEYANKLFMKHDPKELFIAINEFMFNISENVKDTISACYWLEWIIKFDLISKQKKSICECERRTFPEIDHKYQMNIIWMVWEGILIETQNKKKYDKIISSLLSLFCIRYKPNCNKQRKYLLYTAIACITENVNFQLPLTRDNTIIKNISNNIDLIYKQVKKNEQRPNTDYLFNGMNEGNVEKSIKKLETMNLLLGTGKD